MTEKKKKADGEAIAYDLNPYALDYYANNQAGPRGG